MLVAVVGPQGSGKSVLLSEIKKLGYSVIERKTSRSILEDWGVTLQEVNNNTPLTKAFQFEIKRRKWEDEIDASNDDNLWFTERTFIDLVIYATISLGKDNPNSEWLTHYCNECISLQAIYDQVFYLTGGHFSVEKDGVRGENEFYSSLVDGSMLKFYQDYHPSKDTFSIIKTPDLQQRVDIITKGIIEK